MSVVLKRSVRVFEVLGSSPEPLTLARLAEVTQINRVSLGRLMASLVDEGLVSVDEVGRYSLTLALLGPALLALKQRRTRDVAFPLLVDLSSAVGNQVALGFFEFPKIVFVDTVFAVGGRVSSRLHAAIRPLLESHTGRLLLSFASPSLTDQLLGAPRALANVVGHPTEAGVRAEMAKARRDGYLAFDRDPDTSSPAGISVPIFDSRGNASAGVVIMRPTPLDDGFLHDALPKALDTARRISSALGSQREPPIGHI